MGDHAPALHGGTTKKPKRKPRKRTDKTATQVVPEPIPDEADDGQGTPLEQSALLPPAE